MAITKVSALTAKTTPTGSEELLINDGGTSKKIQIDNVTENNFTDTLKSKLDAIEASADVTDTTNVTSAGALMDSEVTNLAQVKAFDTTDYATSTQGTTADNALPKAGGTMTGDVSLGDNVKARFGASDDLQIYHDGSNSYIKDAGTGSLRLRGTDLRLESSTLVHNFIVCSEGGGVSVFHNDSSKLATTSTGVNVTGTVNGLEINTTATSNLGLGTGAVDSITTGDYNVGVGDYALSSVDAGSNNTAIGYVTLNTTTSGNGNTSAGFYSLVVNTAGSYNVASGFKALQANTTASGNTGIGYFALAGNTTGINNVALGYQAGTTNTTGSSNIIIGDTVNAPSATASNQTVIGSNQIQCDASTTAGDTRFFLYDVDNATMERVTVGSADSGGTGYKVLRIPN